MAKKRLVAVQIEMGIITVVGETGKIEQYMQRGIRKLSNADACYAIECGILSPKAYNLKELPSNYSIYFECPEIQGRAIATFNLDRELKKRGLVD